jgi:chemotaxis methyl-accepting protein methylase
MQVHGTFFMRNRPEIEMIRSIALQWPQGATLKLTVLACSNGAEVYSIVWAIRSARPDLKLDVHAIDISQEIIELAQQGVYSPQRTSLVREHILKRLSKDEIAELFDEENGQFRIKGWIAQGIDWRVGDAGDRLLAENLGPADIVVANKFLCHMQPPQAENCLRNLLCFLKRGGHLLVSGVDLDVRTKVAIDLGWIPVTDLLQEIHDGDPSVRRDWPLRYWGLEPLDSRRSDWKTRYAAVFQVGSPKQTHELELAAQKN